MEKLGVDFCKSIRLLLNSPKFCEQTIPFSQTEKLSTMIPSTSCQIVESQLKSMQSSSSSSISALRMNKASRSKKVKKGFLPSKRSYKNNPRTSRPSLENSNFHSIKYLDRNKILEGQPNENDPNSLYKDDV